MIPEEEALEQEYLKKDRMMRNFRASHLPARLREVSVQFVALARWMVDNIPASAERTAGLRKLLEGKDCAVRARLEADEIARETGIAEATSPR